MLTGKNKLFDNSSDGGEDQEELDEQDDLIEDDLDIINEDDNCSGL